jgi:hypothetical protein
LPDDLEKVKQREAIHRVIIDRFSADVVRSRMSAGKGLQTVRRSS